MRGLIRGETGSGKEMVARALHELSSRRDQPFLAVNCSALPGRSSNRSSSVTSGARSPALIAACVANSSWPGAERSCSTRSQKCPRSSRPSSLRVLEDRKFRPLGAEAEMPVRARILAATHVDLEWRIAQGGFREDLYYRLNVVSIDVPSLPSAETTSPSSSRFVSDLSRKMRFTDEAVLGSPASLARQRARATQRGRAHRATRGR